MAPPKLGMSPAAQLAKALGGSPKPSKYKNKRTMVGDIAFASAREARRYCELRILQDRGEISELKLQQRFPLKVYGKLICTYVCDFSYAKKDSGTVIEDVKGVVTDVFKIKMNLMRACYGVEIAIVR